jgi:hypothetical protein
MTSRTSPWALGALLLLVSSIQVSGLSLQGVRATGGHHGDLEPADRASSLSAEHDLHVQARQLSKHALVAANAPRLLDKAGPGNAGAGGEARQFNTGENPEDRAETREVAETPAAQAQVAETPPAQAQRTAPAEAPETPAAQAAEERPAANTEEGREQPRTSDARSAESSGGKADAEDKDHEPEKPDDLYKELGRVVEEESGATVPLNERDAKKNMAKQLDRFLDSMGMKANLGKNEVTNLAGSAIAALCIVSVCFIGFSFVRMEFPQIYANNCLPVDEGGYESAEMPPDTFFGWIAPALMTHFKSNQRTSGTDAALQILMYDFKTTTVAAVALPLICILCPLHYHFGKMRQAWLEGTDPAELGWISALSLNNIEAGSSLVWVHAIAVWYVVLIVELQVFRAMNRFMPIRFEWLADLKPPRSTTLLVENIPEEYCTDDSLKVFFNSLFPDVKRPVVERAYIVKKIPKLIKLIDQYIEDEVALQKVRHDLEPFNYPELDEEEEQQKQVLKEQENEMLATMDGIASAVEAEQGRILMCAKLPMVNKMDIVRGEEIPRLAPEAKEVLSTSGFVSFTCERIALTALTMRIVADGEHFVMSIPPHADDIIYEDLNNDMDEQSTMDVIGWLVVSLLFYAFIPTIVFLARIIRKITQHIPGIHGMGLRGLIATIPLQIYLSFLPTVLFLIFNAFFSLKSKVWGQKLLQSVYFVFNVIFTLLVTAVVGALSNYPGGQMQAALAIVNNPLSIPGLLATSMPSFTQFYIDFLCVRWTQHCLQLTRYVVLAKFILFRYMYGEEMAIDLAEPEDQDFYGMGARYARASLDLMVWLVFCSISPIIGLAALVNCVISRVCYGYLLIYAETRKFDLGGPFFVSTLHQVHLGLLIYIMMMTGVLAAKTGVQGKAPSMIAGSCLIFLTCSYWRFCRKFRWESLPFIEVVSVEAMEQTDKEMEEYKTARHTVGLYRQWQLYQELKGRHHHHHHHSLARMHSMVTDIRSLEVSPSSQASANSTPRRASPRDRGAAAGL